ncbi:hypothetical protein DFH29DRAFT_1008840 [Suillus ampliporus]|nr:hypothetical protein DFH29DRAFT_1008840 [Suillus ampliporus]
MLVPKLEKVVDEGDEGVGNVLLEVHSAPAYAPVFSLKESKELVEVYTHALLHAFSALSKAPGIIRQITFETERLHLHPETDPYPEHAEAAPVAALESKLKSHITTLSHLAWDALAYPRTLHTLFGALVKWGWAFSGVIGVNRESHSNSSCQHTRRHRGTGQSEAFDVFLALRTGLVELTQELQHELHTHILPSL